MKYNPEFRIDRNGTIPGYFVRLDSQRSKTICTLREDEASFEAVLHISDTKYDVRYVMKLSRLPSNSCNYDKYFIMSYYYWLGSMKMGYKIALPLEKTSGIINISNHKRVALVA